MAEAIGGGGGAPHPMPARSTDETRSTAGKDGRRNLDTRAGCGRRRLFPLPHAMC